MRSIRRMQEMNGEKNRPTKNEYYLGIAKAVAARSTCLRRRYGCVIIKDDIPVSFGYNGSPRGERNCCDIGFCWREANNIPHGERYELCKGVHAEQNAMNFASGHDLLGSTMYLYGEENGEEIAATPCLNCSRSIKNARIKTVVCSKGKIGD